MNPYISQCGSEDSVVGANHAERVVSSKRGGGNNKRTKVTEHAMLSETDNVYFEHCPCVNKKIHDLHMELLAGCSAAEFEIDRYLLLCAILTDMIEVSLLHYCNDMWCIPSTSQFRAYPFL